MLITLLLVHFYVFPSCLDNKKQDILNSTKTSMEFVSSSLVPLILTSDYAANEQTLNSAKSFVNKADNVWSSIELHRIENIRLYPFVKELNPSENSIKLVSNLETTLAPIQEKIIVTPIHSLVRATNQLARGDYNFNLPKSREDEIGQLIDNFDVMQSSIKENQEKFSVLFRQSAS